MILSDFFIHTASLIFDYNVCVIKLIILIKKLTWANATRQSFIVKCVKMIIHNTFQDLVPT